MLWSASLETGIQVLDMQHRELFRQVDDVLLNAKNKNRITETLDFLGKYVIKHFHTEELMHHRFNYPKMSAHKKMHDDFIPTLQSLRKEYDEQGDALPVVMKINKTVLD